LHCTGEPSQAMIPLPHRSHGSRRWHLCRRVTACTWGVLAVWPTALLCGHLAHAFTVVLPRRSQTSWSSTAPIPRYPGLRSNVHVQGALKRRPATIGFVRHGADKCPCKAIAVAAGPSAHLGATFAGLGASLATILISEIGDKTFFLAALLSLRRGRGRALTASLAALYAMTCISTLFGVIVKDLPAGLHMSQRYVHLTTAACFAAFGVSNLLQARSAKQAAEAEKEDAGEEVDQTLSKIRGRWKEWWQCALLVFLAEWGDRSMIATVALAAELNPVGVTFGAMAGHTVATSLAVFGGDMLNRYINETTAKAIGGILFLIFAVTTLFGVY